MGFDHLVVSGVSGSVSLACWLIVFTPQIYENWRRQSTDGLSIAFVVTWLLGDIFNVIGSVLQHVLPTMLILAIYYTVADLALLYQCLCYKGKSEPLLAESEREPLFGSNESAPQKIDSFFHKKAVYNSLIVLTVVLCGVVGYIIGDHQEVNNPVEPQPISIAGQINGWICAAFYLLSRIPQILLNNKRKSTDGVSVLFFVFTLIGNITYCVSILAADSSPHALLINASWIAGALGSLLLDAVVMVQFWMYR